MTPSTNAPAWVLPQVPDSPTNGAIPLPPLKKCKCYLRGEGRKTASAINTLVRQGAKPCLKGLKGWGRGPRGDGSSPREGCRDGALTSKPSLSRLYQGLESDSVSLLKPAKPTSPPPPILLPPPLACCLISTQGYTHAKLLRLNRFSRMKKKKSHEIG